MMATRGAAAEAAVLSAGESTHVFFRGGLATFSHFLRVGVTHILGGFDHLLFLLTILVAAGWRYWLATITSFTVAHSISLALAVLGIVRLPAAFVEPAIAASIVLVALGNLWRRPQTTGIHPWRIAVVFACGLLHGVGFSSAVGAMPLDTGNRLATIAGFNLGIEAGATAVHRRDHRDRPHRNPPAARAHLEGDAAHGLHYSGRGWHGAAAGSPLLLTTSPGACCCRRRVRHIRRACRALSTRP